MAIQNVNALVDKYSLAYLENSNYITKYYNEALANLGQRNTEELLLKYNTFTLRELFTQFKDFLNLDNLDSYKYLVITIDETYSNVLSDFELCEDEISERTNITSGLQSIEDNTNEQILFNRKFDIIRKLAKKLVEQTIKVDTDGDPDNDISKDIDDKGINIHEMFVPLDYKITYVCNGINEMILYFGRNDIYVYIIPTLRNGDEYIFDYNNVIYVRHTHNYIKTIVYNYNFYKDDNTSKFEVNVYKKFVLPYIDEENIWQVNQIDTGICAQGKDALELNIITIYQNQNGANTGLKVLSGLSDKTQIDSVASESIDTYIKDENKSFIINCYLPKIHLKNNISNLNIDINDIIKNSTIILICPLNIFLSANNGNNYNTQILKKYGENGLITTVWTYKDDTWEYLSIENDSKGNRLALDLNTLTNFEALIDYKLSKLNQIKPDNFLYRHLIFSNAIQTTKQNTGTNESVYGVIQNLTSDKYGKRYINNLNLSFRYLNTIQGTINKDITNVLNTRSTKYLKFFNNTNTNYITNSLYSITTNNQTNYYDEYIPNYNIPILDLSEILVRDSNVINKQNILSFDKEGKIFYSYFGTSYNDTEKNTVRLGTSSTNINIGSKTMIDDLYKSEFKKHTKLSIDFENIALNGNTFIYDDVNLSGNMDINGIVWNHKKIDDSYEILYTTIVPMFKYIYKKQNNNEEIIGSNMFHILNLNKLHEDILKLPDNYNSNDTMSLYFNIIICHILNNDKKYYYKYNDLLYIPALKNKILKYKNISGYTFESKTNQIINIDGKPTLLVSSDNKLSDNINIQQSKTSNDISIDIINKTSNIFFGCPLDIIIDNNKQKIIINEHKSYKLNSIWKLPTNISGSAI